MKDYSKMSDFEINKEVALSLGIEVVEWDGKICGGLERNIDNVTSVIGVIDYCNNPSDAWPIIFENEISLVVVEDGVWVARFGSVFDESSNPLRSAMIVYLMIEDEEK